MSGFYTVAYAVGFRPWERAGREAAEQFGGLLDREAMERSAPPGRAVDLGCGTGTHTIDLASRGWRAVGIDNQPRALRVARARAAASGTDATFVQADVTALRADDIGAPADFFLDVGCFHHLPGLGRQAMADRVTAAAAPHATLLMLAFSPGRRGPLPPGASREEIETAFCDWRILADEPADTGGMPRTLQGTAPQWYRLKLSQP
ncbi:MAG: class I SAM-dependent methyltransferase [Micromonosporaceae bacterium]